MDTGCINCQAYIAQLGTSIPPHNIPKGTSSTLDHPAPCLVLCLTLIAVIIIGCGSHQPISWYAEHTHSPFPIYTCPSLALHQILGFTNTIGGSRKGEEKEYERELGGTMSRIWTSLVVGPMKHIEHTSSVGPKGQNGGELLFEAGESRYNRVGSRLIADGWMDRWDLFVCA